MTGDNRSKRIKLSEFEAGLVSGKYNDRNVHEVVFGMTQITFQNMSQEEANTICDWAASLKEELTASGLMLEEE